MSSSICISSSSINDMSAVQTAANTSELPKLNRQRRINRSEEMLFRLKEPQRAREMFCKRPSELRSRRTPKGTIIRLSELDQQDSDQMLEDESTLRKAAEENAAGPGLDELAGGATQNMTSDSNKVIEVPLLSLVINKRKGKSKTLIDDYDVIPKSGSRAIITLDDEDQEFVDSWSPDYYVEQQQDLRYPLYSDVLRGSLDSA